jgi:ketosteroid isomerase-like protein
MHSEIERFFRDYAAAYNAGDAAAIARHISAPSLLIERTPTLWSTEADVLAAMRRLLDSYRTGGFASAHFVLERVVEQGSDDAVAEITWTLERGDAPPWRFRTGYNLHRTDGIWRIMVCTAYQESAARQRAG